MSDEALRKHMALQQANKHNHKQPSKPVEDNTNPKALASIDEIFTRLKAIGSVGSAFKTPQEEAIVKQEWMLALREEGVTKQSMIDDGIDAFRVKARQSRGTAWFPSIGEFIDLCLGDNNKLEYAERAYNLFIKRERQIDNVGREMLIDNLFDLRAMPAEKGKKRFIELYLEFASRMEIQTLEAFALTETVQLSEEQQKDADNRANDARKDFMSKFNSFALKDTDVPIEMVEKAYNVKPVGIQQGSLKTYAKTPKQLEEEKQRQLDMIKGLK